MMTRRKFLAAAGLLAFATPLLQACGAAADTGPAATAAAAALAAQSAAKAGATQVVAGPTTGAGAAPTTAAGAAPAPAAGTKTSVSIAVWTIAGREWQKTYAQKYAQAHPDVAVKIDEIDYNEMAKKQLAELATGTLQDIVFSGIKWMSYSAYKGAFRAIDDYVKQKDPGLDDFYPNALAGSKFDGKLYALPFEQNPGNSNVVVYNKDMVDKKGVKPPTDDWKLEDFADFAVKMTDPGAKVWGTDYFLGSYYDFAALARSLGGDVMTDDGKKFTLTTDPKSVESAHFFVDIRTKYKAAPSRAESQGIAFPAGQLASTATGVQSIISLAKTVADKFKWDVVLGPTGPGGLRGQDGFVTMFNMYSKSKQPEAAYDMMNYMTSKEVALWAMANQGQPAARKSVWLSPEVKQVNPIFARAEAWMADPKHKGPFPMPNNLRFSELQDKWANTSEALWYGEVGFDEGIKKVQDACDAIVQLPRS